MERGRVAARHTSGHPVALETGVMPHGPGNASRRYTAHQRRLDCGAPREAPWWRRVVEPAAVSGWLDAPPPAFSGTAAPPIPLEVSCSCIVPGTQPVSPPR